MRAILLTASDDAALRPLTFTCASAMLPLAGAPLAEVWLDRLAALRFSEVVFSTGRGSDSIRRYFGDGRRHKIRVGYSFEGRFRAGELQPLSLGSAAAVGRVHQLASFGSQTLLIARTNAWPGADLGRALSSHRSSGAVATHLAEGIVLLEPIAFEHAPLGPRADVEKDWLPLISKAGLRVNETPIATRPVRSLSDYLDLALDAVAGRLDEPAPQGAEVRPGLRLGVNVSIDLDRVEIEGPVSIGAGSVVRAGAQLIGPLWVGPNSVVDSGVIVRESILGDHSRLAGPLELNRRFVEGDRCIGVDGKVEILAPVGPARKVGASEREDRRVSTDLLRLAGRVASRLSVGG